MKTLVLLHPFSAQSIGLTEKDLYYYHSKPHENAFRALQNEGYKVSIDYFTGRLMPYKKVVSEMVKKFWPVTKPFFINRHQWRKQESIFHYWSYKSKSPDLTIINMSGHGSAYCFKIAKLIKQQNKAYITMIGGIHMSDHLEVMNYYQNAHHLIVHTEFQRQQLMANPKFKSLDIRVIPLGVNTTLFKPIAFENKTLNLLYVGRISRLKQIEKTIETLHYLVVKKTIKVQLDIIGPVSDNAYYEELITMVNKLGLNTYVTFVGSKKQKELIPYYQKAALLLLPSRHESFGMVLVEAMACGTAVIGLKGAGGPDEIIKDGINGFLCQDGNFHLRVEELLKNKNLLLELSSNARRIVEDKWSLNYTIDCFRKSVNSVFDLKDLTIR